MEEFAVPRQAGGPMTLEDAGEGLEAYGASPSEPSLGIIMAAIQDLKGTLEPRLKAVMVDVTLLQADPKKVAEKVTTAETDIAHLQSTSKRLENQADWRMCLTDPWAEMTAGATGWNLMVASSALGLAYGRLTGPGQDRPVV
ncbi:hypothetical protein NDU88_002277 [Pleurodeles waltl]|uniref:Uncharacterized protein n=1 Tax=Pleurodeles waltl TaxID=8319 RepID=A0AAV7NFZ9_PLEWA|nr:hypothetical protein NDU88_002276 [Pleurodeles waltl]KAJ1114038.1 hypothetical protein NDU88_002277 [Pleurodeles waltl]